MRVRSFPRGLAIVAGLIITGCEGESMKPEPAPPEKLEPFAGSVAAAGTEIIRFKARGPFASAALVTSGFGGRLFVTLDVRRGGNPNQETLLSYMVRRCDLDFSDCADVERGTGLIPNADFVVRGRVTTLRTNTSAGANPAFMRLAGSGGPIILRWTENGVVVGDLHVHSRERVGTVLTEHEQFSTSTASASIEGTLIGTALSGSGSTAFVGKTRSGLLRILKGG